MLSLNILLVILMHKAEEFCLQKDLSSFSINEHVLIFYLKQHIGLTTLIFPKNLLKTVPSLASKSSTLGLRLFSDFLFSDAHCSPSQSSTCPGLLLVASSVFPK